MSDSSVSYTASDLRDELLENAMQGIPGARPEVLSAPTKKTALAFANYILYYDPQDRPALPADVTESRLYEILKTRLETYTVWDATRNGDVSSMRGVAGGPSGSGSTDASSWRAADIIKSLWHPDDRDNMLNMILYGPTPTIKDGSNTGSGKSDFAYTLAEGGQRAYDGELTVATNNDTDPFADVEKWTEAERWMQETDGPKLLILDEAAQGLKGKDMSAGDVLGKAMRMMRKYNCHLILIAHTGKDIPLDIRRQVVYARKDSQKRAVLGNKLDEDAAGEMRVKNVEYELRNIPPTTIQYESYDDKGEFEWDIDDDSDDEEESRDEKPQCQATTNADEECPNDAKHPAENPVVCVNHRDQLDDVLDGSTGD